MPWRDWDREQVWLMPPSLDEVLADDHPARLVAALVDSLTAAEWAELGVDLGGQALGAPAYHPRALLGIWLYGFMTGVRSARRLETAGREQLALQWLSGYQQPDHNTLWRFYRQAPQPAARAAAPHGPDRGAAGPGRLGAAGGRRDQSGGLSVVVADL